MSSSDVDRAVELYLKRQARLEHPDGRTDKAGRWYPSVEERRPCCDAIRLPSRRWPYSLNAHCRTIKHVAQLCGVDELELRRAVRDIPPAPLEDLYHGWADPGRWLGIAHQIDTGTIELKTIEEAELFPDVDAYRFFTSRAVAVRDLTHADIMLQSLTPPFNHYVTKHTQFMRTLFHRMVWWCKQSRIPTVVLSCAIREAHEFVSALPQREAQLREGITRILDEDERYSACATPSLEAQDRIEHLCHEVFSGQKVFVSCWREDTFVELTDWGWSTFVRHPKCPWV